MVGKSHVISLKNMDLNDRKMPGNSPFPLIWLPQKLVKCPDHEYNHPVFLDAVAGLLLGSHHQLQPLDKKVQLM